MGVIRGHAGALAGAVDGDLFLNAIDAMPDGGALHVGLRPNGPGAVRVTVADTGVGVTPRDLDQLFKPFFTTKPPGRGSGLGLVVAQGIVADHGGQIHVASEPGQGTAFTIQLPNGRAPDEPLAK